MGEFGASQECRRCRATVGGVQDRGRPWGALCEECFAREEVDTDDAQALKEGATASGPPKPSTCPRCGREQDRRPTGYGRYVLLEPGVPLLMVEVPEELRWFIGGDGRAVNGTGPGTQCRIAHERVCGRGPRPADLPPAFTVVWRGNRVKDELAAGAGRADPPS